MGQQGSKQPEARILILGLDNAGKSTLLYKLKHDICVTTVPTIGFNVEMIEAKKNRRNIALTLWDVGGQAGMRQYWKSYHQDTAGVVFVIDSSDTRRLGEARRELEHTLKSDHLRGRPVVIFANKQDVNGALTVTEITERFNFRKMCSGRCCIKFGTPVRICTPSRGSALSFSEAICCISCLDFTKMLIV